MWDNAMNVYDFDKTIYRGDSTVDFWRHCLRRYPGAARALPGTLAKALAFRQGRCSRGLGRDPSIRCFLRTPSLSLVKGNVS